MQISNRWSTYLTLLGSSALAVWLSQNSINAYWAQTYHQDSPFATLDQYSWWKMGGDIQQHANERFAASMEWFEALKADAESSREAQAALNEAKTADEPASNQAESAQAHAEENTKPVAPAPTKAQTAAEREKNEVENRLVTQNAPKAGQIVLHTGDRVLFTGDSLMQGVAPHMQQWLKKEFGISSINLSKQSTGLSYPKFFDWPATIETTLRSNADVKVLVMLLGANDPWDFVDTEHGKAFLRFQSPEWEAAYVKRIERILDAANQRGVKVIWLGVPYVRKADLDGKMRYLNSVLTKTLSGRSLFIQTNELTSGQSGRFQDAIVIDGKRTRLRSKDGIHFTPAGYKLIAQAVEQHISVQP